MGSQERRDRTFQIKDSIFEGLSSSSRTAKRNPPSNISNASAGRGVFVFCLWSLRYLRETLETPRSIERSIFILLFPSRFLRHSPASALVPFFTRKLEFHSWGLRRDVGLVILDGRHRFSSWKLMDTLTRAKRKTTPLRTDCEFSMILSYVNFTKVIIRHHRWVYIFLFLRFFLCSLFLNSYFILI